MKAYKGFTPQPDGTLKCLTKVYREGETYTEPKAVLCSSGMHACTEPLHVFRYYPPATSVFYEVEVDDDAKGEPDGDSKVVSKTLTIGAQVDVFGMVKVGVDLLWKRVGAAKAEAEAKAREALNSSTGEVASGTRGTAAASGYRGTAAASGYQGTAAASGYQGTAAASGTRGTAAASGYQGTAAASGYQGTAAASGDQGTAAASGYQGTAAASGYQGTAAASGDQGTAAVSGPHSVAAATGIDGRAKGADGCVLLLIERAPYPDFRIIAHKSVMVGHKSGNRRIKPNTWYGLIDGRVVEVDNNGEAVRP